MTKIVITIIKPFIKKYNWEVINYPPEKRWLEKFERNNVAIALNWLFVFIMSPTRVRVNPLSIVAWMSRNSLLETGTISEV